MEFTHPVCYRMYAAEVEKSAAMNEALGRGIAVFQGLSNIVLNCESLEDADRRTPTFGVT